MSEGCCLCNCSFWIHYCCPPLPLIQSRNDASRSHNATYNACPLWRQLDQLNSMGRGLRQSWRHNVQLQPWGHQVCDKYHCFFLCVKSIGPKQHLKHVLMQGSCCEDANWNCWWGVLKAQGWVHARWMQKLWWCGIWQAIVDASLWENLA